MKHLALDNGNRRAVILAAVAILKKGGVIVYPTETAYGLGADFFNPRAVSKVYRIKGRAYNKPLAILVDSFKMAKKIVRFNQPALRLAKRHWPGALTLVLKIRNPKSEIRNKPKIQNLKFKTLGLRISSNKIATSIVKKFGRPITSTSANIAGQKECYSAEAVINQFSAKGGPASGWKKHQPDLIIDAGQLPKRKMSTIVKVTNNRLAVLRQGAIKILNSKS